MIVTGTIEWRPLAAQQNGPPSLSQTDRRQTLGAFDGRSAAQGCMTNGVKDDFHICRLQRRMEKPISVQHKKNVLCPDFSTVFHPMVLPVIQRQNESGIVAA